MTPQDIAQTNTERAVDAAGVFVWDWSADTNQLRMLGHGETGQSELEGVWQLNDFLPMLDGMSSHRFRERLAAGVSGQRLDITLLFADGKSVHLLGAFEEAGRAKGLCFSPETSRPLRTDIPVEAAFQPIIRIENGQIAGFEALARWRRPDGQLLSAGALEGVASAADIKGLAIAMLDQAGAALGDWHARWPDADLFVQVNLTGADLYRADVFEKVSSLTQSGLFPEGRLRIELTEQMALRDFEAGVAAATALQASGAGLVLDDFGSGHSSLAWLAAIPASGLKLDPQLTQMIGAPRVDAVIVALAKLAKELEMTVTAEGVEDLSQVQKLQEIGCDYAQGFAYAPALEKSKADRFLESQLRLEAFGRPVAQA